MEMSATEAAFAIYGQRGWLADPDYTEACNSSADAYIEQINESFDNATDPDGEPWEPIVYREVPPPPLQLSGDLRDSAVADAMNGTVTKDSFETDGSALVDYAANQDQGGGGAYVGWVAKKYGIKVYQPRIQWHPGRPFLGFGEETIEKAVEFGVEESITALLEPWS